MEIKLTLHGHTRKEAADCIGKATNAVPVYRAAPSFDYRIGSTILDRQGILSIDDADEALPDVLRDLQAAGFYTPEPVEPQQYSPPTVALERLVIQMPLDGFSPEKLDNLCKLVASKASLISKALGAEDLPIAHSGETLDFPWFNMYATPDEVTAYISGRRWAAPTGSL
jgi:hypothetical protein